MAHAFNQTCSVSVVVYFEFFIHSIIDSNANQSTLYHFHPVSRFQLTFIDGRSDLRGENGEDCSNQVKLLIHIRYLYLATIMCFIIRIIRVTFTIRWNCSSFRLSPKFLIHTLTLSLYLSLPFVPFMLLQLYSSFCCIIQCWTFHSSQLLMSDLSSSFFLYHLALGLVCILYEWESGYECSWFLFLSLLLFFSVFIHQTALERIWNWIILQDTDRRRMRREETEEVGPIGDETKQIQKITRNTLCAFIRRKKNVFLVEGHTTLLILNKCRNGQLLLASSSFFSFFRCRRLKM